MQKLELILLFQNQRKLSFSQKDMSIDTNQNVFILWINSWMFCLLQNNKCSSDAYEEVSIACWMITHWFCCSINIYKWTPKGRGCALWHLSESIWINQHQSHQCSDRQCVRIFWVDLRSLMSLFPLSQGPWQQSSVASPPLTGNCSSTPIHQWQAMYS